MQNCRRVKVYWGKFATTLLFSILFLIFFACEVPTASWDEPVHDYFEYYTNTAAVEKIDVRSAGVEDNSETTCISSDGDKTVNFYLRNPKNYKLDTTFDLEAADGIAAVQDTDDRSVISITYPQTFLGGKEGGQSIGGTIALKEHETQREFESYTFKLKCNTPPPAVTGASVQISGGTYWVCFYLPSSALGNAPHNLDQHRILINGSSVNVPGSSAEFYSASDLLLASGTAPASLSPAGGNSAFNTTAPDGYTAFYYNTGLSVSEGERAYHIKLEDDDGLSGAEVSASSWTGPVSTVTVQPLPASALYTDSVTGASVLGDGSYTLHLTGAGLDETHDFSFTDPQPWVLDDIPAGTVLTGEIDTIPVRADSGSLGYSSIAGSVGPVTVARGGTSVGVKLRYPVEFKVSTGNTGASITGATSSYYTDTSSITLPSASESYTTGSGASKRFIGWSLTDGGTPIITAASIPAGTYKGKLTLWACYTDYSVSLSALYDDPAPVIYAGAPTSLYASASGFPDGASVSYSWSILTGDAATVSGNGASATVSAVSGKTGSVTVQVTASLSGTALSTSKTMDVSVVGLTLDDAVLLMSDTSGITITPSLAGGYSGSVEYNWSFPAGTSAVIDVPDGQSGAPRVVKPVAGGKITAYVTVRLVGKGITLPQESVDIYVLDIGLSGASLSTDSTNPTVMTTDDAALSLSASLVGFSDTDAFTWSVSSDSVASVSPASGTGSTTLTPKTPGTATVSVSTLYKGRSVSKSWYISVVGLTLTQSYLDGLEDKGNDVLFIDSSVDFHRVSYALTPVGIAADDCQSLDSVYPYASDNNEVATAGSAGSGASCQVNPLKGGTVNITATGKIKSTNQIVTAKKKVTFIKLAVNKSDGNTPVSTGSNALYVGSSLNMTATLEGTELGESIGWQWVSNSANLIVDPSKTNTQGTTVSAIAFDFDNVSITVTATYKGQSYSRSIPFILPEP